MTERKRIFLNVAATYGRSLYALVIGLCCGRWTLMSLGEVDYGLMGVVGGLACFVSFFNGILANSVSRFYGVSVGAARRSGNEIAGLDVCRDWFNKAFVVHTVLPVFLIAVGYPLGLWVVRHFLIIPDDRVADCVWVWRFTCISCFVSMFSVPFSAMYNAKQDIAELTLYSFATTTFNALFLYYMITHPGVWLAKFSLWTCVLYVVPQSIIIVRACVKYPECRIARRYWFDAAKYIELVRFAAARFWTEVSMLVGGHSGAILVNKYCGPSSNAAMAIGGTVANHTTTLSGSLTGAFIPAVANLCGEGRMEEMKRMCFMTCRIGTLLMLVFAIPVALEVDELLYLWLVKPPAFASYVCLGVLFNFVMNRMGEGYPMAIYSKGYRVMSYSWHVGWSGVSGVIVMFICFACGFGMWSVVVNSVYTAFYTMAVRLALGKALVDFEARYWIRTVFVPIVLAACSALTVGCVVTRILPPSFMRIVVTTAVSESILLPLAWIFVFSDSERTYVKLKLVAIMKRGVRS